MADPSLSPILVSPPPPYPGIARALALHLARRAVERQLRAKGLRVSHIPYAQISEQARAYLADHPELLAQAVEKWGRNTMGRSYLEQRTQMATRKICSRAFP
jgi:hypothetical protein